MYIGVCSQSRERMMSRRIIGGLALAGAAYAGYSGIQHWNSIKIFPAQTRKELREALRADLDGRSGDAERSYHDALQSCSSKTGNNSVLEGIPIINLDC